MCIKAPCQRDKLPQPFNAQLHTGRLYRSRLACRRRNQQRALTNMLNLERRRDITSPARKPTQNHETVSKKRMVRIAYPNLREAGIISLIRGDIPVGPRSRGWTGGW